MEEEKKAVQPEEEVPQDMKKSYKEKLARKDEEITKLKEERDHWKNEYYRAFADTQNLRKSLERDHQNALKYRAEGFVEKLLPVLDGFSMALNNEPSDPAIKNYLVGFRYVYKSFLGALESEGALEIAPKAGDKFDSATMHALDTEETEGEENLVVRVCSVGLMLKDRLIRPASVIVSKHHQEEKKEEAPVESAKDDGADA